MGLEPGIDDDSKPDPELAKMMTEDGVPAGRLGYGAILDRGYRRSIRPAISNALAQIIQETVAFWCEQFVEWAMPGEKLHPHVAAPAPIRS